MEEDLKKSDEFIAKEPEIAYLNKKASEQQEIPDYVWEDLEIGLNQYQRGEYISADNLLNKIKFGL